MTRITNTCVRTKTLMVPFMVVDLPSAYNVIIKRPTLNKLRVVVSTYYRSMKFPTSIRPGEIKSDPRESRRCYLAATTIPKKVRKFQFPTPENLTDPTLDPSPLNQYWKYRWKRITWRGLCGSGRLYLKINVSSS
ncbi:hypothetical protein GW17_00046149 [Ensete ventricosum]|nr:hypothetical protein GW17_00046149 [Ensete ventricosum]